MLTPSSTPIVPKGTNRMPEAGDEPMTEDYGEPSQHTRNMSGNVDFFSSLGTERKKKPPPDRPDPEKACRYIVCLTVQCLLIVCSLKLATGS